MSIIDTIKDKIASGAQGGQAMRMVSQLVTDSGGLDGLVGKFNAAGFGDMIKSWLTPAAKPQSISPDQIQKVVGAAEVQSLATKFGLETNEVTSSLASHLPKLIDKFSAGGSAFRESSFKH